MNARYRPPADISIVTCSYNQNRFLSTTLSSVISQRGAAVEYIVIDGASTDGSIATIQRHADGLAYWVSEPDAGQSEALNKGLRRASADIVGWLCSDDVLLPGALARVLEIFRENPDIDAVYGNAVLIDHRGNIVRPKREIELHSWLLLGDHNYIPQPAMFWRRRIHERIGYLREDLHYTMDLELWLRFAKHGCRILHVDEYFAGMRCHPQQKVLVHPVELAVENASLRHEYGSRWVRVLPGWLLRGAARVGRILLKAVIGGYSRRPTPAVIAALRELHKVR